MVEKIPHCSHWGAYWLLVEDGTIVAVEPFERDPYPSPLIHSVPKWVNSDLRILHPMVRSGWLKGPNDGAGRGYETFVPVTWDKVLEIVSAEIKRVAGQYGNAAIFAGSYGWTSAGRLHHAATLLKRLLNLVGGCTDHVDTYSLAAGPAILRHVFGSADACYAKGTTMDTVVENTKTLVVFGSLAPRTAQTEAGGIARHQLELNLHAFAQSGMDIIHVSPLQDDVPDYLGATWWPIKPNTDTALLLGLAGEISLAGHADRSFLQSHCSGSEDFIDYLRGVPDGVKKDAAWAASITGLDEANIRSLAQKLATTRSMLSVSWSLQRAQHGEQPFWAAIGLAAISSQIGLPGGGVAFGYGSTAGSGAPIGLAKSPGIPHAAQQIDSIIPVARFVDMLENPGASFTYQGEVRTYPDTKLIYWAGGNPFHHHQDLNRLDRAWQRPDTIIVQDPMWTPTALKADIVLPACTSVERNDIAANNRTDRIFAMKQAVEPIGNSLSDFDIFRRLAHYLEVREEFDLGRDEMGWLRHLYEQSRHDADRRLGFEMPDFDRFWASGSAEVPVRRNATYLASYRDNPTGNPLATESGKIVLGSQLLKSLNHPHCQHHPSWVEPSEWLGGAHDREYHLISNQPSGRLHSQLPEGPASRVNKRNGLEIARINPLDAERIGVVDGDHVRLFNKRGACLASARLDPNVRQRVIVLPTGSWLTQRSDNLLDLSGNPNILTSDVASSEFGQGCAAYSCLVEVESYAGDLSDPEQVYRDELSKLVPDRAVSRFQSEEANAPETVVHTNGPRY